MKLKRTLNVLLYLGIVFAEEKPIDNSLSIENQFEEVANFLKSSKIEVTDAFSPYNHEIIQLMDSYLASIINPSVNDYNNVPIYELIQIIEDDESLIINNKICADNTELFNIKAGALNKNKMSESFYSENLCEVFSKQVLRAVNFLKSDKTLAIDSFRSKLQFHGNLKNIFDKNKTKKEDFFINEKTKIEREFMTTLKSIKVCTDFVKNKKYFITILPYDDKNSDRYLVHLIPTSNDINLKEMWSRFSNFTKNDFEIILSKANKRKVNFYIPKINNLKSHTEISMRLKLDNKFRSKFVQDNFLTIDESNFEIENQCKKIISKHMFTKTIEIRANRPYILFVYDRKIKKIIFVLKDTGSY